MTSFQLAGKKFPYYDLKNCRNTERRVEVPIAKEFARLHAANGRFLEIGNVVRAHDNREFAHPVIDLDEHRPGWKDYYNLDVLSYEPPVLPDATLSISTLEHTLAPEVALRKVLGWAPNSLVTIPLGYHSPCGFVTTSLLEMGWPGGTKTYLMHRNADNEWREITIEEFKELPYEEVRYGHLYGTATCLGIWVRGEWQSG